MRGGWIAAERYLNSLYTGARLSEKFLAFPQWCPAGALESNIQVTPARPTRAVARVPHQNDRFRQRSASWQNEFSLVRCTWLANSPPASLSVLALLLQPCFPRNVLLKVFETSWTSVFSGQDYAQLRQALASQRLRKAWRKSTARHIRAARPPPLQSTALAWACLPHEGSS